jgi:hypothetical protein
MIVTIPKTGTIRKLLPENNNYAGLNIKSTKFKLEQKYSHACAFKLEKELLMALQLTVEIWEIQQKTFMFLCSILFRQEKVHSCVHCKK